MKVPPGGEQWCHQLKLDGWRLQAVKVGAKVALFTRGGNDISGRLPEITAAVRSLPCRSARIDSELALPVSGGFDFYGLQRAAKRRQSHDVALFAFDLLERDGKDLRRLPLLERQKRLGRLLIRSASPCLHLVESFPNGEALLLACERFGLEGIVSKRLDMPYVSGPSKYWRKIKTKIWKERNQTRWKIFQDYSAS